MPAKTARPPRKRPQDRKPKAKAPRKAPRVRDRRAERLAREARAQRADNVPADYEIVDEQSSALRAADLAEKSARAAAEAKAAQDAAVVDQNGRDALFQRTTDERARPCPFCGAAPKIAAVHFPETTSKRIACDNDACPSQPSTIGKTTVDALARWNQRRTGLEGLPHAVGELGTVRRA